ADAPAGRAGVGRRGAGTLVVAAARAGGGGAQALGAVPRGDATGDARARVRVHEGLALAVGAADDGRISRLALLDLVLPAAVVGDRLDTDRAVHRRDRALRLAGRTAEAVAAGLDHAADEPETHHEHESTHQASPLVRSRRRPRRPLCRKAR